MDRNGKNTSIRSPSKIYLKAPFLWLIKICFIFKGDSMNDGLIVLRRCRKWYLNSKNSDWPGKFKSYAQRNREAKGSHKLLLNIGFGAEK
jgi:hypothetical protein